VKSLRPAGALCALALLVSAPQAAPNAAPRAREVKPPARESCQPSCQAMRVSTRCTCPLRKTLPAVSTT
jgi:hypothetical protein